MQHTSGPVKICVLYDPQDGRVVHTHQVVTLPGGRDCTDSELEAHAIECAKQAGHEVGGLATLRVTEEECDGTSQYRVDLAEKKLRKAERRVALPAA